MLIAEREDQVVACQGDLSISAFVLCRSLYVEHNSIWQHAWDSPLGSHSILLYSTATTIRGHQGQDIAGLPTNVLKDPLSRVPRICSTNSGLGAFKPSQQDATVASNEAAWLANHQIFDATETHGPQNIMCERPL